MTGKERKGIRHSTPLYLVVYMISVATLYPSMGNGQLFPGLEGETLADAIREEYTPILLLSDSQVRDTLYARVFKDQDSVRCIYSGLPRHLPEGVDPSQWLFGSGTEVSSINLEHGWPQAKGAGEGTRGNRDMHHLYPSRSGINSDRANFPFAEIPDALTQKWYYLTAELNGIPNMDIHLYSEFRAGSFEPRESVKGDIARAMFYFWTIYRDDAMAADPNFFELQRSDLCVWQEQDPPDALEEIRNQRIAVYQDGKLNPFILDCTLAQRAYCPQLDECEIVSTPGVEMSSGDIRYDHATREFIIVSESNTLWHLRLIDMLGRMVSSERLFPGERSKPFEGLPGIYLAYAVYRNEVLSQFILVP